MRPGGLPETMAASRPPRPPFIPPIGPLSPLSPGLHQWCAPAPAAALCAQWPGRATRTLCGAGPPRPPGRPGQRPIVERCRLTTPAHRRAPVFSLGKAEDQCGTEVRPARVTGGLGRTDGRTDKTSSTFTTSTSGGSEGPMDEGDGLGSMEVVKFLVGSPTVTSIKISMDVA